MNQGRSKGAFSFGSAIGLFLGCVCLGVCVGFLFGAASASADIIRHGYFSNGLRFNAVMAAWMRILGFSIGSIIVFGLAGIGCLIFYAFFKDIRRSAMATALGMLVAMGV